MEYCNCGHNGPLIVDAAGGIRSLPATGVPLGLYPDGSARAEAVRLSPQDLMVLFTDGVTEAVNPEDEEFLEDRLHETVRAARNLPAQDVVTRIFTEVDAFAREAEQADDITCLVLRCLPSP